MKIYAKAQLDEHTWISIPLNDNNVFTECSYSGKEAQFPLISFLKDHHFQEWTIEVPQPEPDFDDEEEGALDFYAVLSYLKLGIEILRAIFQRMEDPHEHQ